MMMKAATKTFDGDVLRVIFFLFFALVSFSACKEKKEKKIPSDVKGVPIHPRTKRIRVVKDAENRLEIQLTVNHSPLQTIVYYRKKLSSMRFDIVEDLQRADTARIAGVRGLEHLQVEFKKTGELVEVKLLKRRLKEEAKVFKGPSTPEDIPLPKEIQRSERSSHSFTGSKEAGKSEILTQTRETPVKTSWPPELRVKLPGHWRVLLSEPDPLVKIQRGFYTERKDMEALVGEIRKVLRQRGWKPMDAPKGLGLSSDEGRFLLFAKGGKTISAQLDSSSDGVQLVLSLSGG